MTATVCPPVRIMIREAVEELGSPTTNVAVRDCILGRYPGTNPGTISAHLTSCSVNQPSRIHYPENHRPGVCGDPRYDLLYCPARGQLEWYRPERHGVWSIERDGEDGYAICCDGGELIRPAKKAGGKVAKVTPKPSKAIPITQEQIDAANRLHARMPQWASTDRAFERLARAFPDWEREACILKASAINDLYSTRVYAIWRMADHLGHVMVDPPSDAGDLVAAIGALPEADGSVPRRHWSFASKIGHFFVDGDRFPIYDSFCREMLAFHLGRGGCVADAANPFRAFVTNLERLRELSGLSASLRDLDRYMWLAGQYRAWLRDGDDAQTNAELRATFEHPTPEDRTDLDILVPPASAT